MSIVYNVKAAIVNESKTEIQRLAAKITQVSKNTDEDFIKTFPVVTHPRNLSHYSILKEELETTKKTNFLGISFISYGYISFIHFTAAFKLFQLDKDDELCFYLDNGEQINFIFTAPKTAVGFVHKNVHPIKDAELQLLSQHNIDYWKITSAKKQLSMIGGFCFNEYNKQYKSQKVGQKMLKLMAENILIIKDKLNELGRIGS
ncbi:MAG TPA: hypothetical protein VL093_06440 [Flavipsychrobacter sp.]|nr:hypothetical protein [Flavipsychrobacter sp.]